MQLLVLLNFAAAIQGLFLTYIIAHNRLKETKSVVLGLLTFVLSLSLLGGIYGMSGFYKTFPHFTNVADPMFLLYGPLLFIYIFVLTRNRLPQYYLLHGLPFLIYIISFIPLYIKSGEEKIEWAEYIFLNDHVPLEGLLMQLLRVVHISIYIILSLLAVKKYQKKIKDNFSDIEKISLNQAKNILYFFLFALVVACVSFVFGYFLSYSFSLSNNIIGLVIGIIIFALAYSTWNKKNIQEMGASKLEDKAGNPIDTSSKVKGRNVFVLTQEQLEEYGVRLATAIEKEKVFIENELSLAELSKKINIQAYQLSELISRLYNESFFDFINRHRIEEIKARIEDPESDSYSLLGIAMDCGFNSKSSFNTAFKKFTGVTPSEYRKQKLVEQHV
ncbi:AraC family transcriptional regulator [Maribellus sp. CM-23]|uniref:helix-turn-helix domain-containing protein n=1 Tax=Maribellus sp. CM-23 TaxID=2781026 RepID=UPI001F1648DB|nr:helix-turn-helix domain-containing protein [Maribellus sp. CM-23]MCE4564593.1 AraC family transcriptional regulator [Maribellus sp. CM-23]